MAISDGLVVATGALAELRRAFPSSSVQDFDDATIVPGFNDAHCHLTMAVDNASSLDLSDPSIGTLDDALEQIRVAAASAVPGQWVRAVRYDDGRTWGSEPLSRRVLDSVAPDTPVVVTHVSCHWGVANSTALRVSGIDEATPEPDGGTYGRDSGGSLNGILYERAFFDFALPSIGDADSSAHVRSTEERLSGMSKVLSEWHAAGLTSICDAAVAPADVEMFQRAVDQGLLTMRSSMLLVADHYTGPAALRLPDAYEPTLLRFAGVKLFLDGAIGGRTCMNSRPHRDGSFGIQTTGTDVLREVIERLHRDGARACVHANGDVAIDMVLTIMEEVEARTPRAGPPHRIEHGSQVSPDLVQRIAALGVIVVPFSNYARYHGGNLLDWYSKEQVDWLFAHRSLLDAGVALGASSDYPCSPVEPLAAMQSLVTRVGQDGVPVGTKQRIEPHEALALLTTGSATACGEEQYKGRLAPGFLADFVVLGDDPRRHDPLGIASIPVLATVVGGVPVWSGYEG